MGIALQSPLGGDGLLGMDWEQVWMQMIEEMKCIVPRLTVIYRDIQ